MDSFSNHALEIKRIIKEEVILIQTKAVYSALKNMKTSISEKHINHCVKNSIEIGKGSKKNQ